MAGTDRAGGGGAIDASARPGPTGEAADVVRPPILDDHIFDTSWEDLSALRVCQDLAVTVSHVATFELDTLTGGLSWSPNASDVIGCAQRAVGQRLRSLIAPMLAGPPALRHESEYELEQRVPDSDGRERTLLIRAHSWHNEQDATSAGLYGAVVDVTEQRIAEQHVLGLIDRYRLLVELSPDAIVVHEAGIVRFANSAAATLNRSAIHELVGTSILDFVDATDVPDLVARIGALTEPGMYSDPTEVTLIASDGTPFRVEAVSVRTTWEGRDAFQVIMRDISDKDAARAATIRQARLVQSVSDAIVATDADGWVTSWNPAATRIFGWTAEEAVGRPLTSLWLAAEQLVPIHVALADHATWSGELEVRRQDGAMVPVHVSMALLPADGAIPGDRDGVVAVCSDQSLRRAAERERARAEERFTNVVSVLDEGIAVVAADGTVQATNPAACRIFGLDDEALRDRLATGAGLHACAEDGSPLPEGRWPIRRGALPGRVDEQIIGIRRAAGDVAWLRVNVSPLDESSDAGADGAYVCSFTDITDQRNHAAALTWAASHDELTGLSNRSAMHAQIEEGLAREPEAMAVLFCDLDRFKDVNDSFGHRFGDAVLWEVARRFEQTVSGDDVVGRPGADEFLVVCPSLRGDHALRLADRLLFELSRPIDVPFDGTTITVTLSVSIGIALAGGTSAMADADELLQAADVAMYRAKVRGRNRVEVFNSALLDETRRRLDIREDLRIALETGQLEVHYQPLWRTKADARACTVAGFEALVRWDHPERGRQNPADFVAIAEETGLISALGMYVLERACRQTVAWRAAGHDVYVSVNLSAKQLSDRSLVSGVAATLLRVGLPPQALWLELTESALADEGLDAVAVLDELVGLGVRISIDDFGTGYSSLGRLRHYPVSALKVDRSFVADMTGDTAVDGRGDGGAIVESTIALAHRLGLAVIAEGVETTEQLTGLAGLHCEFAQGFLLGRPVPADQVSFTPLP